MVCLCTIDLAVLSFRISGTCFLAQSTLLISSDTVYLEIHCETTKDFGGTQKFREKKCRDKEIKLGMKNEEKCNVKKRKNYF